MGLYLRLSKFRVKLCRWLNGEGFTMPEMDQKTYCMYNYCKSMLNGEDITPIHAYEVEIERLRKKHPIGTREDVLLGYISGIEWVYGKGDK